MKNKTARAAAYLFSAAIVSLSSAAQQPTAFLRTGGGSEAEQTFSPGECRARIVLGNYILSKKIEGHDLGGSTSWYTDTRWGDQGDGTFANPVLCGDYSDPDVIRVGEKYYLTCSEFHYMGMSVLESDDMVNWKIISHVFDSINLPGYDSMEKYGCGTWAPALRYHGGKYWIFVCTPNEGLFMTTATNPAGPWEPLYQVKSVSGWEDPCPLWDDETGKAYLGHSRLGGGPIILHEMSPDGTALLDDGVTIYEGDVAEGTKFYKLDGLYYLSIPEGGVGTGWQTVLRADDIYGPYTGKKVLEQGATTVNGPHQGAFVDTPDGQWWFYHFQSVEPQGRIVHLEPVVWEDGFPIIGEDYDKNGVGEPVKTCAKPATGKDVSPTAPQAGDDFSGGTIGLQWQFNHNPDWDYISLSDKAGWIEIIPQYAANLREAKNQLTQKTMGYKGLATVKLDFSELHSGGRAGMECIGNSFVGAGVMITLADGLEVPELYVETDGETLPIANVSALGKSSIYMRLEIDAVNNSNRFMFSADGETYYNLGETFASGSADWKGSRVGLFSYMTQDDEDGGKAFFDDFTYLYDGPGGLEE